MKPPVESLRITTPVSPLSLVIVARYCDALSTRPRTHSSMTTTSPALIAAKIRLSHTAHTLPPRQRVERGQAPHVRRARRRKAYHHPLRRHQQGCPLSPR